MHAAPRARVLDLRTVSLQPELYHGWPTVARSRSGDLLLVYSGGRESHVCPFGRVDLMRRSGLFAGITRNGWYPVVTAETIQFRRSLTLGQRFSIVTRVLGWDDRAIVVEQLFERGGETIARAYVRARFLRREGGTVPTADLLALAGVRFEDAPVMPPHAGRWNADNASWPVDERDPTGRLEGA